MKALLRSSILALVVFAGYAAIGLSTTKTIVTSTPLPQPCGGPSVSCLR